MPSPVYGPAQCRAHSTRTYAEALRQLNLLTSNHQTTNLFDNASSDPNALAIPEMLTWLSHAGYAPKDLARLRHIHVAGTKGKGSVCAFATSILRQYPSQAGSVGTFTSPHLVSPRERIAIDGEAISEAEFAEGFFELWDRFGKVAEKKSISNDGDGMQQQQQQQQQQQGRPFYFRYLTILAWHVFLKRNVGSVVLECGIGGEYDATNVVPAEAVSATVVTQLGIDHVAMLGYTVEEIAWHKAGIFKAGVKGFTRKLQGPGQQVMDVLRRRTDEREGATLVELEDEAVEKWGGVRDGHLQGDFQKYNQALAVMAVREHLGMEAGDVKAALTNLPVEMTRGLREAKLRGRCEVVDTGEEVWWLDGAHTRDSLEEVGRWAAQMLQPEEKMILVFNQQERDAVALLGHLLLVLGRETGRRDCVAHAIFTRNEVQPPESENEVDMNVQEKCAVSMKNAAPHCSTTTHTHLKAALAEAKRLSRDLGTTKVLATGSLHLIGGILQVLEPS